MQKILKSYLKRLTNLTGNNKSLLLLRLSAEQDLDIHKLDLLNGKPSFAIIEQLIAKKSKIILCDVADSRDAEVNEVSRQLQKIQRKDKFIYEERGAKDLCVGWPFVRGKLSDGTVVRAPLLFFPVSLEIQRKQWVLALRKEVSLSFNKSFLLAYAHFTKTKLKDKFMDKNFENFDADSQIFRTSLYELLKDSPVELNFNQDIFVNKIQSFQLYKRSDYEAQHKDGELKLFPEAVLGLFPQAGSYLVPDYDFLIENNSFESSDDFFSSRSPIRQIKQEEVKRIKEEEIFTPFKLDASQEQTLEFVRQGNSMVVQGPPGTGKSQLISNLIADFTARGKKVLLVCQKKAALDVVYNRLSDEVGIGNFLGLIHDFKNDRKKIYDQINLQIEKLEEYKLKNNSLDAILIERSFTQVCRRIDQIVEELQEFKEALYDTSECGVSIKELYLTCNPESLHLDFKQEFKYFKAEDQAKFIRALKGYLPYALKFEKHDYLWRDRISFKEHDSSDFKKINELIDFIPFYQAELSEKVRELTGASLDLEDMEWIADRENLIHELIQLLEDKITYSNFIFILNKDANSNKLFIWEKQIKECFKDPGIETSLQTSQLGDFQKALESAYEAKKKFYKWIWWWFFSKEKIFVQRGFVNNKLKWDKQSFEILMQKIDNRMNLEHNLTGIKLSGWLQNEPRDYDLKKFEEWVHYQHMALAAKDKLKELRNVKDLLNVASLNYEELKEKLLKLLAIVKSLPVEKKRWKEYLTPRQISKLLTDYSYSVEIKEILKKDFEALSAYDKLQSELKPYEVAVINKLLAAQKDKKEDTIISLFQNSMRLHWLEYIESKYPLLRDVSSMKLNQLERELEDSIKEKLLLSKEICLMHLREATYKNASYNRLNNMTSYRDLKHQVSKKKKIWPVRRLMAEFSAEIFDLVPCWLASPESVSAVFPMQQQFDLIIFDEASQCYAEKGIPSVFRGAQLVIAGDDKQLSPNDLYQVRWEGEEEEELPDMEVDSLLDIGKKYLKESILTGHYRSRSLDLIEFSNRNFYNNNLRLVPDLEYMNAQKPGIEYVKIAGIWKNNVNLPEAEKVLQIVIPLIKEFPEKSVGIVTFNFPQQVLIQDLLEEFATKNNFVIPGHVFVKNIENVQGDERDVIIFSLGYAPDEKGRFKMSFGSLNMAGGENRLNVAVTRAREKNYIVSSIMPQELKVDNTKNAGPGLLKKYLEYAWEVSEGKFQSVQEGQPAFNFDWYLSKQLMSGGDQLSEVNLTENLPFADLAVLKNQMYKAVLLTDDNQYYQSGSPKEFHAYRSMMLQEKKWKYKKIFSRQYWLDRSALKVDLKHFFDTL